MVIRPCGILFGLAALQGAVFLCTGVAADVVSYPDGIRVNKGSRSGQAVQVLATDALSGTQDVWSEYIEFTPTSSGYSVVQFLVHCPVDASAVTSISVDVNYRGEPKDGKTWTFQLRRFSARKWTTIGSNDGALPWEWSHLNFVAPSSYSPSAFINSNSNNLVKLRMHSGKSSVREPALIDYIAVTFHTNNALPSGTPSASPAPLPSRSPLPSSTPTGTAPPSQTPSTAPSVSPSPVSSPSPSSQPSRTPVASIAASPSPSPSPRERSPVWQPGPGTTFQWQLQGTINTSFDVDMYDIDLFDVPTGVFEQLKADGRRITCYFSAGSFEAWREDWSALVAELGGMNSPGFLALVGDEMDGWDERWLNIHDPAAVDVIKTRIMGPRIAYAAARGCDAVEPDNVDSWTNANGAGNTAADQLSYNRWLASEAHAHGLSIGLKNDLDQIPELVSDFDFAVNEQCWQYNECDTLQPFVDAGKAVFGVEYSGNPATFCPPLTDRGFTWLKKRLDLFAWVQDCRDYTARRLLRG